MGTSQEHKDSTDTGLSSEQARQESQYAFPYHHLAHEKRGAWRVSRALPWGFEQLGLLEAILGEVETAGPASLLDFGCGDGRLLLELTRRGRIARLAGVDYSRRSLALAQAFFSGTGDAPVLRSSLGEVSETFDMITMVEVLEHIPDSDVSRVLGDLRACLAEGGRMLISVPTTNIPVNAKHFRHYDEDLLRAQVEPHFRVEKVQWVHRCGQPTRLLAKLLHNRLFTLEFGPALRLATRAYRRYLLAATASNGAHLLAVLRAR